jgi:tRNA 2-selenouridine synthase
VTQNIKKLSAEYVISSIIDVNTPYAFIDVRTQGEWDVSASPGFTNRPLLNNEERHLVGLCYKKHGQAEAIQLAEKLFEPNHAERLAGWLETADHRKTIVCCWRGGMRSQRVALRLREEGIETFTVEGGYKALRHAYLNLFERRLPPFLVVAGLTGSNKTGLLHACNTPKIDLEGLANHRGSTFGAFMDSPQPAQITFENRLGLEFFRQGETTVLLEDESAAIGKNRLPNTVRDGIYSAPLVVLEADMQERTTHIIHEYIEVPVKGGTDPLDIRDFALFNLGRIERKLGGKRKKEIEDTVKSAFENGIDPLLHQNWIAQLLESYYDPMYSYGLEKHHRQVLFKGDFLSCQKWIEAQRTNPSA